MPRHLDGPFPPNVVVCFKLRRPRREISGAAKSVTREHQSAALSKSKQRHTAHKSIHLHPGHPTAENDMSKGMDSKKGEKKKPAKTMKEKRAAKQEKKKG